VGGVTKDLVGAGQKSGLYWVLDAETGALVWKTQTGPGGHLGGLQWGTAYDGSHVYFGVNDTDGTPYSLAGTGPQAGQMVSVGSWGALDPTSGDVLWQIANPAMTAPLGGASVNGPVTVVGGVMFVGSMDAMGTMYALDATSGAVLWSFQAGGTVYGGPAVSGGVVYWGAGYPSGRLGFGTSAMKLYAFAAP
jgi:polyvinyl alcohol dehydrogenase (cytochrome)